MFFVLWEETRATEETCIDTERTYKFYTKRTRPAPCWESNPMPSCCEATILHTQLYIFEVLIYDVAVLPLGICFSWQRVEIWSHLATASFQCLSVHLWWAYAQRTHLHFDIDLMYAFLFWIIEFYIFISNVQANCAWWQKPIFTI